MTRECGARAESKNCEILLFPTADRRFDTKVKCPTGRASFWVKFPTVRSLTRVKGLGIARGGGGRGGMGGFGIDWYITERMCRDLQRGGNAKLHFPRHDLSPCLLKMTKDIPTKNPQIASQGPQ